MVRSNVDVTSRYHWRRASRPSVSAQPSSTFVFINRDSLRVFFNLCILVAHGHLQGVRLAGLCR